MSWSWVRLKPAVLLLVSPSESPLALTVDPVCRFDDGVKIV